MICKTCNREIDDNSKFCVYCGANTEQEIYLQADPVKEKRGMSPGFIILIVLGAVQVTAVVVAAVFAVLYFYFGGLAVFGNDVIFEDEYSEVIIDNDPDLDFDESHYDTEPETEETETAPAETAPAETAPLEPVWENSPRLVIANGGLNLRSEPNTSSSVLNLIPNGTVITVEKMENNWAYVCYGDTYGWCSCDYLFVPVEYTGTLLYSATVHCDGYLEMQSYDYAEKDTVYTDIPNGTMVYVYKIEGDRAFVKYNNIYGWCLLEYLELM